MAPKTPHRKEVLTRLLAHPIVKQLPLLVLVAVIAFILGTRSTEFIARFTPAEQRLPLGELQVLYNQLKVSFDGNIDAKKALEGAKKGLVEASGDPYTTYFTHEEAGEFDDERNGKYEGIGAELGRRDNNVVIISTMDDSPAKKAGLMGGDIVAQVDEQETLGWQIEEVVKKIRGKKGTKVKMVVLRDGAVKEFTITRAAIVNPSVKSELLENNIGYMRISRFGDDTSKLALQQAQSLSDQGADRFILDLRGNGGGNVDAAQAVASIWLENVTIATQKRHDGELLETYQAYQHAPLKDKETVVLIDGGSASASEIVAGALHDHNAAKLVGEKTFGKGSVQQMMESVGGELKVTIAKWYTPHNKNITKDGIKPDITVRLTAEEANAGQDPQKAKAIELLR